MCDQCNDSAFDFVRRMKIGAPVSIGLKARDFSMAGTESTCFVRDSDSCIPKHSHHERFFRSNHDTVKDGRFYEPKLAHRILK